MSTVAGEVLNPELTFSRGLVAGLLLVTLAYFFPLLVASGLDPSNAPWQSWEEGAFREVGMLPIMPFAYEVVCTPACMKV